MIPSFQMFSLGVFLAKQCHWKILKTHENPWEPMRAHENTWKYVNIHEQISNYMEIRTSMCFHIRFSLKPSQPLHGDTSQVHRHPSELKGLDQRGVMRHSTRIDPHRWSHDPGSIDITSTAQGGGGNFKDRTLFWRGFCCCDARMGERIHWWTERWLELCFLEWLQWLQWSAHPQLLDVVWCSAAVLVVVV